MGNFAKGLGLGLLIGYAGVVTLGFIELSLLYYETQKTITNTSTYRNYYSNGYSRNHPIYYGHNTHKNEE